MPSKRKQSMKAKQAARRDGMTKPSGQSKYGTKRRRMDGGWDNPRSPIRRLAPRAAFGEEA